jgi:hypothetical protein
MSHFIVMVIGNDPEAQLAPFQENNMEDCPEEYLSFRDDEDEYLKKYNTESVEKVIMPDGRMLNPWDKEFRVEGTFGTGSDTHKVPENLEKKKIPYKELFPTFEEYMSEWCGYKERDNRIGRFGYWENPNAKWDWYRLGGRWSGFFKLKLGAEGTLGEADILGKPAEPRTGADQALKGDIDFEAMMDAGGEKARERYEKLERLCGGTIPKIERSWDDIWADPTIEGSEKKRDFYHSQPALKKIAYLRTEMAKDKSTSKEDQSFLIWLDLEEYQTSKEEFIYNAGNSAITTFALIRDGKWFEKGSMGWWGMVSNEKDKKEWHNKFATLIADLPDNTLLSVYDCHI